MIGHDQDAWCFSCYCKALDRGQNIHFVKGKRKGGFAWGEGDSPKKRWIACFKIHM